MNQQEVESIFEAIRQEADDRSFSGDLNGALACLDKAFFQSKLMDNAIVEGYYWRSCTMILSNHDLYSRSLEASYKSAACYESVGMEFEAAKSQVIAVGLLGRLHKLDEAEILANKLILLFKDFLFGRLLAKKNLADAYAIAGKPKRALEHLLSIYETCQDSDLTNYGIFILTDIALAYERLGEYDLARDTYERSSKSILQSDTFTAEPIFFIKLGFNHAILLIKLGRFEEALGILQKTRQENVLATPSDKGFVDMAEGAVRGYLGDSELAVYHFKQAITHFVHPLDKVETQLLLCQHIRANRPHELVDSLQITHDALELLREIEHAPFTKLMLIEQAESLLMLGRLTEATHTALKAQTIELTGERPIQNLLLQAVLAEAILPQTPEKAADYFSEITREESLPIELTIRAWSGLGDAQFKLGSYEKAAEAYQKALHLLQGWRRFVTGHASQAGLMQRIEKPFKGLLSSFVEMKAAGKSILILLEQIRSHALAELDSDSFVLQADGVIQQLINEREQLLRQLDMQVRPLNHQSDEAHPVNSDQIANREVERTIAIKSELLRVEESIRRERPEWLKTDLDQEPITSEADSLPFDTAMLTWFQTASKLYVLVLFGDSINYFPLNYSLEEAAGDWHQLFRQFGRRRQGGSVNRRSADLWQKIIAPIRETLARVKKLLIVPTGPLWQIPFGGLIDQKLDRYVAQRWEITVAPGLKIWEMCQSRSTENNGVLLVGAAGNPEEPDYLPAVLTEISVLQNAFPDANVLTEEAVTRVQFAENLRGNRLVHFAGHIEYDAQQPVMSGIRLHDQRYFRASDFYLQPGILAGAHVVLSGCDSGRVHQTGSEIVGLTSALIAAGAKSVLVTLWPIDDQAAAQFMSFYYAHLRAGMVPAAALKKAQDDMQRSDAFSHPLDWAAFVSLFQ